MLIRYKAVLEVEIEVRFIEELGEWEAVSNCIYPDIAFRGDTATGALLTYVNDVNGNDAPMKIISVARVEDLCK